MSKNQQILLEMQFQLGTPFILFDSVMKGSQLKMLPFLVVDVFIHLVNIFLCADILFLGVVFCLVSF